MICTKHNVDMPIHSESRRWVLPLHRCPVCCAEFREAVAKVLDHPKRDRGAARQQHLLPPVTAPERWPT